MTGLFKRLRDFFAKPFGDPVFWLVLFLLVVPPASLWFLPQHPRVKPDGEPAQSPRHLTFIAVNDIYRLDGVGDDKKGGLARLRTLRKTIERDAPNAFLLHAGDFLAPSLISKVFKGKQMIDIMNRLDGDSSAFDHRMFVVFGNHEFDDSRCNDKGAVLEARVLESQFTWLNANLDFSNCWMMRSLSDQKNVKKNGVVMDVNNVKVGLFGIGLTPDKMESKRTERYPNYADDLDAARRSIEYLKARGAEFIVALTHLPQSADEELLNELGTNGLDMLVGGHEHSASVFQDRKLQAWGFKSDSDALTARRIEVELPRQGRPKIKNYDLIRLDEIYPPDADIAERAKVWSARAEADICKNERELDNPDCLSDPIGSTQAAIELRESASRTGETGFGDWLADQLLAHTDADVAIVTAGLLGLDSELAAGTKLRARHIVEMFRYDDDVVAARSFPATMVCEALRHGFASPGAGAWPHISGAKVKIQLPQRTGNAVEVTGFTKFPQLDCTSKDLIKVASMPFVLCGNDSYPFRPDEHGKTCIADLNKNPYIQDPTKRMPARVKLGRLAEQGIKDAGDTGINPKTDGRVGFSDPPPKK
jgi:2',3'-cyclic-nucleotide 2'-phosphodiesterase (5'-nucleotidase family)